eukprot:8469753-Alexandrium_andersonii.AAC.1
MLLKPNLSPAVGVGLADRRCSRTPCNSRALASWQRILITLVLRSAGRPIDEGTARRPSAGET